MNEAESFHHADPLQIPTGGGVPSTLNHPDEVLEDTSLTPAEKRAILASWVSDAHAVQDAPSLRRLDSGAVVPLDTILEALRSLDASDEPGASAPARKTILAFARPPRPLLRLRGTTWRRSGRDDDDPPPCPAAAAAVPVRLRFVKAFGERLGEAKRLAVPAV
jgi:hypothetical protein